MSGFFCNFCAFRFCFENHISFLQSCAFGFAVINRPVGLQITITVNMRTRKMERNVYEKKLFSIYTTYTVFI